MQTSISSCDALCYACGLGSKMNRRSFLKTASAAPAAGLASAADSKIAFVTEIKRLNLRHTWTTTMSSSQYRDTLHTAYTREGITGHGEGAPIVRYHEDAAGARKAADSVRDYLLSANPMQFGKIMAEVFARVPGEWAGKAAVDIALMDWVGQKLGIPLYTYFGLDSKDTPLTTFSIGIDTPEITKQKTLEAADYPVLKVKVGLATDEPTIEAVRSVTKKPLRVDANEGWKDKEEAVRKINWLEKMGVEFIEQPMPAEMIEETRWIRSRVHIPIIADEACQRASDIPNLKEAFDGINVKLDKSGGMLEAFRMIQLHVDAVEGFFQLGNVGCALAGFVGDDRDVNAAAYPAGLFDHFGGHGLLDELHAHFLQPVDLANSLFLILPAFVGVHAQRLLGNAAHGLDGGLVGGQADFHFQDRIVGGLERLLFRDLRGIDADGECGERRVLGVESEISVERDAELLAHPIHERDIHRRLAGPLSGHARKNFGHVFAELHGVGGEQVIAH